MVSRPAAEAALDPFNGLPAGELASALTACSASTTGARFGRAFLVGTLLERP